MGQVIEEQNNKVLAVQNKTINVFITCDKKSLVEIVSDVLSVKSSDKTTVISNSDNYENVDNIVIAEDESKQESVKEATVIETPVEIRNLDLKYHDRPGRPPREYTSEEVKLLLDDSLSGAKVAKMLGVCAQTVYIKRRALKEGKNFQSSWGYTDSDIKLLLDTSISTSECARRLGKCYSSIYAKRKKLLGPKFTSKITAQYY